VSHCSYLLDRCFDGRCSFAQQEHLEAIIYQLYPELREYPNAWELLAEGRIGEQHAGGEAEKAVLVAFNLLHEIGCANAAPPPANDGFELVGSSPHAAALYLDREFAMHRGLPQLLTVLSEKRDQLAAAQQSPCTEVVIRWLGSKVLDVEANQNLCAALDSLKSSAGYTAGEFLQALQAEHENRTLVFRSHAPTAVAQSSLRAGELLVLLRAWIARGAERLFHDGSENSI
jgi:hypothetical protein